MRGPRRPNNGQQDSLRTGLDWIADLADARVTMARATERRFSGHKLDAVHGVGPGSHRRPRG
jgi:hypothetical protein